MIVQCCQCKEVEVDGERMVCADDLATIAPEEVSHGLCPTCLGEAMVEVAQFREKQKESERSGK